MVIPWADTINLIMPVTVEAVITEEESVKDESTTIKLNLEDDISEKVSKKKVEKKTKKTRTKMSKIFEEK